MEEKKIIYCVDDESSIRELYQFALTGAGFSVSCFEGGAEMFAEVKNRIPALFILDIMLDGADGYEILRRLRENVETREKTSKRGRSP